ncbi:hypothetical protein LZ495_14415 [Yinghuangia sp. KLBMP8922]|uniref:Uncharacterized protein n=1 Tax=Yinghuangia soli TaxID=2908204 RepID=A0AA41U0B1_9ACTN|nr:hypothetical protein [Yinghuangia soli]
MTMPNTFWANIRWMLRRRQFWVAAAVAIAAGSAANINLSGWAERLASFLILGAFAAYLGAALGAAARNSEEDPG